MFTDSTVTPKRLECLIDLLKEHSRRQWTRADIIRVLQPKGLPDLSPSSDQGNEVIKAGVELGVLIEESGQVQLTAFDRKASARDLLLETLDQTVLSSTEIEPFYAPFYSYLLSLGPRGAEERKGETLLETGGSRAAC